MAIYTGVTHDLAGVIIARCLLSVFEASSDAGAPYYLSLSTS